MRSIFRALIRYLKCFSPLNAELNPFCRLLTLLGAHHILNVSRIRVKGNNKRILIYEFNVIT